MSASQFPPEVVAHAETAELAVDADGNFQLLSRRIQQAAAVLGTASAISSINAAPDQAVKLGHLVALAHELVVHAQAALVDLAVAGHVPILVHGGPEE